MVLRVFTIVFLISTLASGIGVAQTIAQRDPAAVGLAAQSLKAAVGITPLSDVVLQGTVMYVAGSDEETGTFTLEARGNLENRIVLNLSGGQRQEIRNGPSGTWIGPDGVGHPIATHNCWTDPSWFFPALSLQAALSDPQLALIYVAQESRDGLAVQHLQFSRILPGQTPSMTAEIQRLSLVDLYLEVASYLPLALAFKTHPDDDLNLDIPVEVQFGDYRLVNGVKVPFHVQKSLQGSLLLDINLSGAVFNSGLSDSLFAVQVP